MLANQTRLSLYTSAYWLMFAARDAMPAPQDLAKAAFAALQLRQLRIAARITETAARARLTFAAACPEADRFRAQPAELLMPRGL